MNKSNNKIEINPQFKKALDIMENTSRNVFITGKAGTGKSTLLEYFRARTDKKIVVLAPTGVAALNVAGQTIHSFFRFKPGITLNKVRGKQGKENIYRELDAIVIDEISMVRADLLDCVDKFMRLSGQERTLPFGGAQMIFFGDLYQLPPVVIGAEREIFKKTYESEYFFSARVFEDPFFELEYLELEKIYRQKDERFIKLLNSIRNNSATAEDLNNLNKRCRPETETKENDFTIYLTPTNRAAQIINKNRLSRLNGESYTFRGSIAGNFKQGNLPTEEQLTLKIGAQIMLLNNDRLKRWVNGTVGRIVAVETDGFGLKTIRVKTAVGHIENVSPFTWEIFNFVMDPRTGAIGTKIVGSFTQYPLKLAWAVTIHKSQGKTFDKVIIDVDRGTFAHGQMYVALSRCTSLEGMTLKKPIEKRHIWMDWRVVKFVTGFQYKKSDKTLKLDDKVKIIEQAIANGARIEIVYLKANDIKSERIIKPLEVGCMEYMNKTFLGLRGICAIRKSERVFRVDRILEMNIAG